MNKIIFLICLLNIGCNQATQVAPIPLNDTVRYEENSEYKAAFAAEKSYYLKKMNNQSTDTFDYYLLAIDVRNQHKSTSDKDFYYAYTFEKDIYYLNGQDTLRPALYHLEQGLGGSSRFNVNLTFLKNDDSTNIIINDKYGEVIQFNYSKREKSSEI